VPTYGPVSSLTITVLDVRQDPEPDYWPALRAQAGLRADWSFDLLRIAADEAPSPLLVTVMRIDGEFVGVVCAVWTGVVPWRRTGRRPLVGVLDVRSPCTSAVPGWWFTDALPPAERRQLFAAYARGMRRELGVRCRGILWRQVTSDLVLAAGRGGPLRFSREFAPCAVLPLRWATDQEWLASLRRSRRKSLRRNRRMIDADSGVTVTLGSGRSLDPDEFVRLVRAIDVRYGSEPWSVPMPKSREYLQALVARDDVLSVSYVDRDGRLIAIGTVFDHPTWPVSRHWGALSPEQGGRKNLWFDRYGRVVEWAIGAGKTGLVMGKGKAELKAELGAELIPQYTVAVAVW
jgi:hypothetical protein